MCLQIACSNGCIITLVAFVWLFSTVRFQMCPQCAWIRACIVALVAFVWLFSDMDFQMSLQVACIRGCIITLVAFVWIFSTVHFQMCPQMARIRRCIITQVAFVWLSLVFNGNYFSEILHGILMLNVLFHRQQVERFCPLLLLVLNWKKSIVKLLRTRKRKWYCLLKLIQNTIWI